MLSKLCLPIHCDELTAPVLNVVVPSGQISHQNLLVTFWKKPFSHPEHCGGGGLVRYS